MLGQRVESALLYTTDTIFTVQLPEVGNIGRENSATRSGDILVADPKPARGAPNGIRAREVWRFAQA